MKIGFHTDAFNSSFCTFEACLKWAQRNNVRYIETGLIDSVHWMHGLGYMPAVASFDDPLALRRKMEGYGVRFSQIDVAFPVSGREGALYGVPYVLKALPWAKHAGAPNLITTDGLTRPEGFSDDEAMDAMKRSYEHILSIAEPYEISVNIEIHGYFTTKPDMLGKMLDFVDSPWFGLNFDTGNSFIAGLDPVELAQRFAKRVRHVHIKDVPESLAAAIRGNSTGIALSHCAIGDGVNADNIRKVIKVLHDAGYTGALSMECEGQGGPMIEQSLAWMRKTLAELGIEEE